MRKCDFTLNTKGRAFLGGLFDVHGSVVFEVNERGWAKRHLVVRLASLGHLELFVAAYGGVIRGNEWLVKGRASERFAREILCVCPAIGPELELYQRICRICREQKRFVSDSNGEPRRLPLTEAERRERKILAARLGALTQQRSTTPAFLPIFLAGKGA